MRRFGFAAIAIASLVAHAQPELRLISPRDTDPLIQTDLAPHLVAIDPASHDQRLLYVHLVGSCGIATVNRVIVSHAAAMGFHAIGITYPNCPSVTDLSQGSEDPDVHAKIRAERLYGQPVSDLVDVGPHDSVVNRVVKLVEFLDAAHPDENWGQFLTDSGAPRWQRLIVGGHSQGSGHAAFLAKDHPLGGALLFGGPGDGFAGGSLAPWVFEPAVTPAWRRVGFTHRLDSVFNRATDSYAAFGMGAFGPSVNVDFVPPPYQRSLQLTSLAAPGTPGEFHGCVVVDAHLAREPDGTPIYAPVWTYMLARMADAAICMGDINNDGRVGLADLSILLANYGSGPDAFALQGDLDNDGDVDLTDLSRLLADFGSVCP